MNDDAGREQPTSETVAPQRTLWMLEGRNGNYSQLIPIYALSEEDANELADKFLADRHLRRVALTAFPDGFVIHYSRLPGKV